MKRHIRAALTWLAFCATSSSATNLLTNPDFDTDFSGWTHACSSEVSPVWDGSTGSPSAGSASLRAIFDASCISQCVNIAGGQSIDLSVRSYGDLCASDSAYAGAYLTTFDLPDCAGSYGSLGQTTSTDTVAGWNVHTLVDFTLPAPVQSVAISPWLIAVKTSPTVNFDHVEFGLHSGAAPTPGVINADFDGGLCGWRYGPGSGWDDSTGSPTPGSAVLSELTGVSYLTGKCMDISENIDATVRSLGDDAFQQSKGFYFAGMIINYYQLPGCDGTNLGFAQTSDTVTSIFGWNLHSLIDSPPPAGAQSLSYSLNAYPGSTGFPNINMDHVYVGPHRLFADSFE
jgi:hypothetical protein